MTYSVLCTVCNHAYVFLRVSNSCMDVCIWQLACANQSVSSPSQSHTQPVYLSALLRTLWFVNQPCSTCTATDKSCLSHHGGFLSSIQTHSNVSPSLLLFDFLLMSMQLEMLQTQTCRVELLLFRPCVILSRVYNPPQKPGNGCVYEGVRQHMKDLQEPAGALTQSGCVRWQAASETPGNKYTHKARDACQESSYTISPHHMLFDMGKSMLEFKLAKQSCIQRPFSVLLIDSRLLPCTLLFIPEPDAQNLLLALTHSNLFAEAEFAAVQISLDFWWLQMMRLMLL